MPDPEAIASMLKRKSVQALLRFLTKRKNGDCHLRRIMRYYATDDIPLKYRAMYALPFFLIDRAVSYAGSTPEVVREKVFGHYARARALVNTARAIGKYGLQEPQTFSAPLMIVWNFTQACNFSCKHCYQNALHQRLEDELTVGEQLRIVDELADLDVPLLAFAGGEPLMSKSFWPVAEHAREREMHLTVATNGSLVDEKVAERLAELNFGYVEISVDSVDPRKHDEFRGAPGFWEKAVRGIRNAVAAGLKVGFSATITKMNFDELDELIEFAKELGCHNFYAFNFVPTGRGQEIIDQDITPEMREQMLKKLHDHLVQKDIAVMTTAPQLGRVCMQYADETGVVNTGHYGSGPASTTHVLARYIGGCGAGRCYCAIQPNGDVTPCVFMPGIVVGNLRNETLEHIWETSEVFQLLRDRDDREEHCKTCDYKYHCGGCRARSYGYFGNLRAPDPGCIRNSDAWRRLTGEKGKGRAEKEADQLV